MDYFAVLTDIPTRISNADLTSPRSDSAHRWRRRTRNHGRRSPVGLLLRPRSVWIVLPILSVRIVVSTGCIWVLRCSEVACSMCGDGNIDVRCGGEGCNLAGGVGWSGGKSCGNLIALCSKLSLLTITNRGMTHTCCCDARLRSDSLCWRSLLRSWGMGAPAPGLCICDKIWFLPYP